MSELPKQTLDVWQVSLRIERFAQVYGLGSGEVRAALQQLLKHVR